MHLPFLKLYIFIFVSYDAETKKALFGVIDNSVIGCLWHLAKVVLCFLNSKSHIEIEFSIVSKAKYLLSGDNAKGAKGLSK